MDYQIIKLSNIDTTKLTLVKESTSIIDEEDHSRWVFKGNMQVAGGECRDVYLKIWNPRHVRRENLPHALEAGFYDKSMAAALRALIYHDGICRGYVTDSCEPTYQHDIDFYENLKRKTIECGFFSIQYSRYHLGLLDGRYSMFDLEEVYPIADLPRMPAMRSKFDDDDYGRFVISRFLELNPESRRYLDSQDFLPGSSWKTIFSGVANQFAFFRWIRVRQSRACQWLRIKSSPSHVHLLEL